MCLPHFRVSHLDAGECVLSFSLSVFLSLYVTHKHSHTTVHTRTCSGGLRVEERLPWVTHSDKVLSRWAILIYVNKPRLCRERQKGPQMSLGNLGTFAGRKGADKEQCRRTHMHTHRKAEKRYWTVEKDTNTVAESDDKFSHTKSCFCGCKIKQSLAGNLQCGVRYVLFLRACHSVCCRGRNRQAGCLWGLLLLIPRGL